MAPEANSHPQVVSQNEWTAARKKFLAKEKEFTRLRDELNAERRRLPMVRIEKDYEFDGPAGGPAGRVSLLDLFQRRRQLIIYHFMFDPSWDEGCPGCSFIADNFGHPAHLHARNTSFAVISRAPLEKLDRYQTRMGWSFPWFSSLGSSFNYDFHVTLDESVAPIEYNYQDKTYNDENKAAAGQAGKDGKDVSKSTEGHGVSTFLRDGDSIYHTYSSYARGCELLIGTYNYLDLTALGRQENWEEPAGRGDSPPMKWLRRHDQYAPNVVELKGLQSK